MVRVRADGCRFRFAGRKFAMGQSSRVRRGARRIDGQCCPDKHYLLGTDARRVDSTPNSLDFIMKNIIVLTTILLTACSTTSSTQTASPTQSVTPTQTMASAQTIATEQERPAPAAGIAPARDGLSDLGTMTFGCPKAGLNAAAREAAKAPSQGTYQFSYFKIISDSHHASYVVHFKSNYHGEPDLKYCVSIYCQQGWDPKTTKTTVSLIGDGPRSTGASAAGADHGADCGEHQTRAKRRLKR